MTRVSRAEFAHIMEWLRGARNWIGRGSQVDGESYYMLIDGVAKLAAEHFWDDVNPGHAGDHAEFWQVNDILFKLWREQGGYTIKF